MNIFYLELKANYMNLSMMEYSTVFTCSWLTHLVSKLQTF
jgi:hypothetical protein